MMQKGNENKRNKRELDLPDTARMHGKCLCEMMENMMEKNNGNWYH